MSTRIIAIGDIHGCSKALAALIDRIEPGPGDRVITLGDLIDRGRDSRAVLDRLIELSKNYQLIALMGDHEELLLDALDSKSALRRWLANGGAETLRSYGWKPGGFRRSVKDWIPNNHREFLSSCRSYYETNTHLFAHAGYIPELPMCDQPDQVLRWRVIDANSAVPHSSGKVAILGHTAQLSGELLDLGFLICIDTNCARGGWLTAIDVDSRLVWQADSNGTPRFQSPVEV